MDKVTPFFDGIQDHWTAEVPLPGGDFPVDGVAALISKLQTDCFFLDLKWATRLIRAYGTEAWDMLGDAKDANALGELFGYNLTETEVRWLTGREYAQTAEDVLWRRSKLGLRLTTEEAARLDTWMTTALQT